MSSGSPRRQAKPAKQRERPAHSSPAGKWLVLLAGLFVLSAIAGWYFLGNRKSAAKPGPNPGREGTTRTPSGSGAPFQLEPERVVFAKYGGSESCRGCHEEAFEAWQKSNHGQAERPVDPVRDRPAFDPPRSFHHGSQRTAVQWKDGKGYVTSLGLSGKPETYQVQRVIGNDPLQQFLVAFPEGRFQTLEAAYDPHAKEWFNVYGNEDRQPGEWGHWTGRGMNWNAMCAGCHNTRVRKNYVEASDSYHTAMAEMTVSCESCHGPLKAHNQWQQQYAKSGRKDPTLTKLSHAQIVDNCGFCHARRSDLTGDFQPGDAFLDDMRPSIVDATDTFYPDGQIRDEDYELSAFLGSRMHARGVYCLDCHNPHSAKTILPGNWLCMRCHNGTYTNAPLIEPVSHSHHRVFGYDTNGAVVNTDLTSYKPKEIKETGGECVNCHMPQTTYMQRHGRHDHGFTIPDPLLTKQFGIPNACNRCHTDKDPSWSLDWVQKWYGPKMDRPTRTRAQLLARARRGDASALEPLLAWLVQEPIPYWRAAAVNLLGRWSSEPKVSTALLARLGDTNALVRTEAADALAPLVEANVPEVTSVLRSALDDPVRSVRVAAAWVMRASVDPGSRAGSELRLFLDSNADQPAGQMQKGIYYLARNDSRALEHFRKAVQWDTNSVALRTTLAAALSTFGRPQEALEELQTAARIAPQNADVHYELALAYNEAGRLPTAAAELQKAVQLDPQHGRAWYNLGLAQNSLGQSTSALESLERAESIDPRDPRIPYARATILAANGRNEEARSAARRALEIQPGYPPAEQLLESLGR